ncbi:MAG: hypothetical protein LBD32_02745 [Cytophagales bacterium]|nr:hypothetical protein [Cytophagales bacterium]
MEILLRGGEIEVKQNEPEQIYNNRLVVLGAKMLEMCKFEQKAAMAKW